MTRVIAGVAGGRRLQVPSGAATRPTADRVREGLFSSLTSLLASLDGLSFLDLYAGSGAVGIEAASRGAARVTLVERAPAALRAIRANLEVVGLPGLELRAGAVERTLSGHPSSAYHVAFLDPPYDEPVDDVLAALAAQDWLTDNAIVVVERRTRDARFAWPETFSPVRSRRYGDATLWYGRRS
jgi:16S rRNA (guanine966-N2)-methyltransferase